MRDYHCDNCQCLVKEENEKRIIFCPAYVDEFQFCVHCATKLMKADPDLMDITEKRK